MDLDTLASAIRNASNDPGASKLADLLIGWKDSDSNATELERDVERFVGNTWIADAAEHGKIYSLWSSFRGNVIHGIGGMTMNERLYHFGLFPRWDSTHSEEGRKAIYAKLLGNP